MPESWEILTMRGLAATDERAEKFVGSLVIHREGNPESSPLLSHENLGRLLARSTGITRRTS